MKYPIFSLFLLCFIFCACDKQVAPPAQAPSVTVVQAEEQNIHPYVEFVGRTTPDESVNLVARVEGFITARNFTEGAMVDSGQMLFEIESTQYLANLKLAKGEHLQAKANLENLKLQLKRQEALLVQDATTREKYDSTLYDKIAAEGQVEVAAAKEAIQALNVSYTKICAPYKGWIGLTDITVGNLVSPQTGTLATVVKTDPMRVRFNIPERALLDLDVNTGDSDVSLRDVKDQLRVQLIFETGKTYPINGRLAFNDNQVNRGTGTFTVVALFDNPQTQLTPNMFVRVRLSQTEATKSLMIPVKAITKTQAGDCVTVIGPDNIAQLRYIKTGFADGLLIAVNSGLSAGEKVVTEGIAKARPKTTVTPVLDKMPVLKSQNADAL